MKDSSPRQQAALGLLLPVGKCLSEEAHTETNGAGMLLNKATYAREVTCCMGAVCGAAFLFIS